MEVQILKKYQKFESAESVSMRSNGVVNNIPSSRAINTFLRS